MEQAKHVGDALSVGTAIGTVAGWLPAVAALFTICWTGFRSWEMITGRPFSESALARWIVRLVTKK